MHEVTKRLGIGGSPKVASLAVEQQRSWFYQARHNVAKTALGVGSVDSSETNPRFRVNLRDQHLYLNLRHTCRRTDLVAIPSCALLCTTACLAICTVLIRR